MELREALSTQTVADVGYRDPVSVEAGTPLRRAVALMRAREVGCLIVQEDEKPIGIFTERDLLVRVFGAGRDLERPVDEVMTREPNVTRVDEPIHMALARMHASGFRHLPVVDGDGRLLGTLSVKRAVHYVADLLPAVVYNLPPEPQRFPVTREGG